MIGEDISGVNKNLIVKEVLDEMNNDQKSNKHKQSAVHTINDNSIINPKRYVKYENEFVLIPQLNKEESKLYVLQFKNKLKEMSIQIQKRRICVWGHQQSHFLK